MIWSSASLEPSGRLGILCSRPSARPCGPLATPPPWSICLTFAARERRIGDHLVELDPATADPNTRNWSQTESDSKADSVVAAISRIVKTLADNVRESLEKVDESENEDEESTVMRDDAEELAEIEDNPVDLKRGLSASS